MAGGGRVVGGFAWCLHAMSGESGAHWEEEKDEEDQGGRADRRKDGGLEAGDRRREGRGGVW